MWFLEVDIAVRFLAATLLWALGSFIARKYWSQAKFDKFLVILDLALIAYVSEDVYKRQPLGVPVEPEVYIIYMGSESVTVFSAELIAAPSAS